MAFNNRTTPNTAQETKAILTTIPQSIEDFLVSYADAQEYAASGKYGYQLEEILRPFQMTLTYCQAAYKSFFAFYGAERANETNDNAYAFRVAQSAKNYAEFIKNM